MSEHVCDEAAVQRKHHEVNTVHKAIWLTSRLDKIESALEHANSIKREIADRAFYDVEIKLNDLIAAILNEKEDCEREYRELLGIVDEWE